MLAVKIVGTIISIIIFAILGIYITGYTSYGDIQGFSWKINRKQLYTLIPIVFTIVLVKLLG